MMLDNSIPSTWQQLLIVRPDRQLPARRPAKYVFSSLASKDSGARCSNGVTFPCHQTSNMAGWEIPELNEHLTGNINGGRSIVTFNYQRVTSVGSFNCMICAFRCMMWYGLWICKRILPGGATASGSKHWHFFKTPCLPLDDCTSSFRLRQLRCPKLEARRWAEAHPFSKLKVLGPMPWMLMALGEEMPNGQVSCLSMANHPIWIDSFWSHCWSMAIGFLCRIPYITWTFLDYVICGRVCPKIA